MRSCTSATPTSSAYHIRAAVMRREAIAIDEDDVDIARSQGDALLEQIGAAIDQRVKRRRSRISRSVTTRGRKGSGLARLLREELLDDRVRESARAPSTAFVVFEEAGHRFLTEPLLLDELFEHVRAPLTAFALKFCTCSPMSRPERSLIANGPIGNRRLS